MSEHANFPIPDGLSEIRLHLRDDDGRVTETIKVKEHRCVPQLCESPAHCETCGGTGATRILLIGSTEDGMDIFVCYPCLESDAYAVRSADPEKCANPWHAANPTARLRPCPECPPRLLKATDGTEFQEVDGRTMKRLPFASGWSLLDH